MCIVDYCREIYHHLTDTQSKMIYMNRLNYSLTGDNCFIENIVSQTVRQSQTWKSFCESLKKKAGQHEMFIFGAGIWGDILYHETKEFIRWKAVIDSHPLKKSLGRLPIVAFRRFVEEYKGENVVLSSFKNIKEMSKQLKDAGIPDERIVDAASVIYELTEKAIYFDLTQCKSKEEEIFIDAGGFDGLTTLQFMNWCGGNGYSYIFEPDERNIVSIESNLKNISNYEIVPKALWSGTSLLAMNARGDFATAVRENTDGRAEEIINSISLDEYFEKKKITFIKMDIEGSEKKALQGAVRIIVDQKPKLAISIYHKAEDIWEIPHLILEYCPEYKFYLRHYSFSGYDTVLYAVVEGKNA